MPSAQRLLRAALPPLLYALAALAFLRPIWSTYADHLTPDAADPLFTLYVLKWDVHQLRAGLPALWDANYFYPLHGALALSDHFLGPALGLALAPNPVAGYNALLFASFVLAGCGLFWVLRRSGCSWPAAFLGGGMFAFSPYRLSQLNHLQILLAAWIPLTLWAWDRLLAERTARRAALFLAFYALNLLSGCYFAYMIHFPLAAILVSRAWSERSALGSRAALRVLLPTAAAALALAALAFAPYLRLARHLSLVHDPREAMGNAAALASYLSPAPASLDTLFPQRERWAPAPIAAWRRPFARSENALFAGLLPTALFLAGGAAFLCRHRRAPRYPLAPSERAALVLLGLFALLAFAAGDLYTLGLDAGTPLARLSRDGLAPWGLLAACLFGSLGAALLLRRRWAGGWPLRGAEMDPWERGLALAGALSFLLSFPVAYLPLMGTVPGLASMRVPARFASFFAVTLIYFAARAADAAVARLPGRRWRALAWMGLALLLAVDLAPRPLRWVRILSAAEFPPVYRWLAGQGDVRALVEIPLRGDWTETAYMYYSTLHWKPIANGYSSFIPPGYEALAARVRDLPDRGGLDLLRRMGVSHLVAHTRELGGRWRRRDPAAEVAAWEGGVGEGEVTLVYNDAADRVYRLLGPDAGSSVSSPKRAGRWKSGGSTSVGDQALHSAGPPSRGRSMR